MWWMKYMLCCGYTSAREEEVKNFTKNAGFINTQSHSLIPYAEFHVLKDFLMQKNEHWTVSYKM